VTLFGAVEIGGTKTDLAVGTSPTDLSTPHRLPTSEPSVMISAIGDFFAEHRVDAVGVASFGPLDLDLSASRFGTMMATPKPGWTGTPLYQAIVDAVAVPVGLDTDVNGAALGEGRWGAGQGLAHFAYMTVGTGIGAGIVVDGATITGARHPEAGHVRVDREPDDRFEGVCPYHGDCLEGLASGPALEARFGRPETWAGNDAVVALEAHYLARAILGIVYTAASERVIVGGGVSTLPGLHDRIRHLLGGLLAGYPDDLDLDLLVSRPGLGELSGLSGGLVLAERALA